MALFCCLATFLGGRKKRSKDSPKSAAIMNGYRNSNLQVNRKDFVKPSSDGFGNIKHFDASVPFGIREDSALRVEMVVEDKSERTVANLEAEHEGGNEHEEINSMKRDLSDVYLQARAADNKSNSLGTNPELNILVVDSKSGRDDGISPLALVHKGHLSDPGMGQRTAFWLSPVLKRSCSNIESKRSSRSLLSPMKSGSFNDPPNDIHSSPQSVMTSCSADRVMLKKRSSSQVLPSRSRKLWWKLFLWSHRNLQKTRMIKSQKLVSFYGAPNQKCGCSSGTLEPNSSTLENEKTVEDPEDGSQIEMLPQSKWVAFSAESSSLNRVNAWVNSLEPSYHITNNEVGGGRGGAVFPNSAEMDEISGNNHSNASRRVAEEVAQANNIIHSLNSFSSVAHISGMSFKNIPPISAFSSLRSVNLSGNCIVHIAPGLLPRSLHMLDLSRNKIAAIEGLRDLTRLRVLNLSYNRITLIGHGLSNCTLIKELYLTGNKISGMEGLHRLLKLTVLDLSFNKISTAKDLGQLVANYKSLLVLNLLGNPIQNNAGDDILRKTVTGLLPQLTYLNKQPIKSQRVRDVATDGIVKTVFRDAGWSSRKRSTRRVNQVSGSSVKGRDAGGHRGLGSGTAGGGGQKSSTRRLNNLHQHSSSGRK